MDFEPTYTAEQEAFRTEVQDWLRDNIPGGIQHPADSIDLTFEQYQLRRELGRRLGDKGWLWPTAPQEYGGGGLTVDHSVVLEEEIDNYNLSLPPYYDSGGRLGGNSILVWGSEEQKQEFLPKIFKGEIRTWQLLTEPEAGSDLANAKTAARRDGDDYVINGQKVYVGSAHGSDYMWTITCTDPEGDRHHNLSWFMVPSNLPGISVFPMDLLSSAGESGAGSGVKNIVYFDNVRVPARNLIGGENEGWKVATTHLELEHGTGGKIGRNWIVDRIFDYCKTNNRRGESLSRDPDVRERLVDIYIDAEIGRLFQLRNYWMRHSNAHITYEGPQASYFRKQSGLRIATGILDILGPAALTKDEQWGAGEGHIESHQRAAIIALHPGGTTDIQKVIMARRIGIGRQQRERAGALA
ncbi:MAG: acyl-CoA dehydrogenase family protein [Chloroflexota bacterium]|nr:acyl-CoA dehydrogenase family protein [Chloroflexota bacterium]MDE2958870.1 acyl-CoA dehydrogenase family protein [Chloroflexota bacterium]